MVGVSLIVWFTMTSLKMHLYAHRNSGGTFFRLILTVVYLLNIKARRDFLTIKLFSLKSSQEKI